MASEIMAPAPVSEATQELMLELASLRQKLAKSEKALAQAEELQVELMKELTTNEARLNILVETFPDMVWLKSVDGVFFWCNPLMERLFGAKEKDIIGKTDYDFFDKELADFVREHDRKAMAAGGPS